MSAIRAAVEAAGFAGYAGAEIFARRWWGRPMNETLRTCIERFRAVV